MRIDLINQCQVFVTLAVCDFIDPDGLDRSERAPLKPPRHNDLDRLADLVPGGAKRQRRLLPRQLSGPVRQEQYIGGGHLVLAATPGHLFDFDATLAAINPAHPVQ